MIFYQGLSEDELSLEQGQIITLISRDWWLGEDETGRVGVFPCTFVKEIVTQQSNEQTDPPETEVSCN
jgi:hypothetical protein